MHIWCWLNVVMWLSIHERICHAIVMLFGLHSVSGISIHQQDETTSNTQGARYVYVAYKKCH